MIIQLEFQFARKYPTCRLTMALGGQTTEFSEDDSWRLLRVFDDKIEALRIERKDPRGTLAAMERRLIVDAVSRHSALQDAARELGISQKTLWEKRKLYGLPVARPGPKP